MSKNVTAQEVLKEIAGFPLVYTLIVSGTFDGLAGHGVHDYQVLLAATHNRDLLEGLKSRIGLMKRTELKELLLGCGVISHDEARAPQEAGDDLYVFSEPKCTIQTAKIEYSVTP